VTRADIDVEKWDNCITRSENSLIYALSVYLDHFAKNWDALVLNDYEAVMPLPWNKKYGFYYLYQPVYVTQLGVYGNGITPAMVDIFLNNIPRRFRLWEIDFNENNRPAAYLSYCTSRVNMHLPLDLPYEELSKNYHRLTTRMIRKANEASLTIRENADPGENIRFYTKHYPRVGGSGKKAEAYLTSAFNVAQERNELVSLALYKGNEMAGMYMLLKDAMNIYSVIGGSSPAGKDAGGFYYLTDYAIRIHCRQNRVFRFEGSDKSGIAAFNGRFGAIPVHYLHLKVNRLPLVLRYFK